MALEGGAGITLVVMCAQATTITRLPFRAAPAMALRCEIPPGRKQRKEGVGGQRATGVWAGSTRPWCRIVQMQRFAFKAPRPCASCRLSHCRYLCTEERGAYGLPSAGPSGVTIDGAASLRPRTSFTPPAPGPLVLKHVGCRRAWCRAHMRKRGLPHRWGTAVAHCLLNMQSQSRSLETDRAGSRPL